MDNNLHKLESRIKAYKRKHFKNLLLRGALLFSALVVAAYVLVTVLEYFGRFSSGVRGVFFFGFLGIAGWSLYVWLVAPLLKLMRLDSELPDEEAARQIGEAFPQVKDKLLNVLQLRQLSTRSELALAGMSRKAHQMSGIQFTDAIDYRENRRYLRYLLPIFLLFIGLVAVVPQLFTESTERIVRYSEDFAPQAPFQFDLKNNKLQGFRGENFTLEVEAVGASLPAEMFLSLDDGRRLRMQKNDQGKFSYEITKLRQSFSFHFEAAGFSSASHALSVLERPVLGPFTAVLDYPAHVGKPDERLENAGNITVPEGTKIRWEFQTRHTEKLALLFGQDSSTERQEAEADEEGRFFVEKQIKKSGAYALELENQYGKNPEEIAYFINAIPDAHPRITLSQFQDSVMYDYLMVGGAISDDYGFTSLSLKYRVLPKGKNSDAPYKSVPLKLNKSLINQDYFHRLDVPALKLNPGDRLEYFVEVRDNDSFNGPKATRSSRWTFNLPDKRELEEQQNQNAKNTESSIAQTAEEAKEIRKKIEELADKLKGKEKVNWQDEKELRDLLKQQEELRKKVQEMAEQNRQLQEQQERFSPEKSEQIREKAEQLQKLMEEVLDEETKKLYDELEKLLEERREESEDFQEILDQLENKEFNLEKELERAKELFKQLQFEQKMDEAAKELEELAEKQEELSEETKEAKSDEAQKKAEQKQEELNKEFEDIQKKMEDLKQLNDSLKNKKDMEDLQPQQEDIAQEQQKSQEQLQQGKQKKASESQKKAAEKMKKMAQQMQQMQASMQMQQMQEDYEALRQIMENLITLSFDQEDVLKGFREVQQEDPRFITLSQQQVKIRDDAQIVEDSLRALGERVFQIQAFINRELTDMNDYLDQAADEIKKRNPNIAAGRQQAGMTSMNNLALLLNDVMQQMQQSMSSMMPGKQMCNKPGNNPSMSQQQGKIGQQIRQLKKSGKSGRKLSEELAKLAAQQEALRRALEKQMGQQEGGEKPGDKPGDKPGKEGEQPGGEESGGDQDGGKSGDGGNIAKLLEEMEKTEEDLVNKRLTRELLERVKNIETRLLEAENAQRQRGESPERESQSGKKKGRTTPPALEEYLRQKQKQIELLRSIPAQFSPYYKKAVNEYFNNLNGK